MAMLVDSFLEWIHLEFNGYLINVEMIGLYIFNLQFQFTTNYTMKQLLTLLLFVRRCLVRGLLALGPNQPHI